ncbi:MAG: extracellular solute-binding protein [Proteobacteria bacterium]|nr:extracellular solute-binding protein [Pseudomonadota bacterium]
MKWLVKMIVTLVIGMPVVLNLTESRVARAAELAFWTTEIEPKRMSIQKELARRFSTTSEITVEIVPVDESELPTRVVAAAAANALPDMIFVPLDFVINWVEEGILDPKASSSVIKRLGADTFAAGPLRLAATGDGWAAVPADGWGQLLLFRKDLFAAVTPEGVLGKPDTWQGILAAAQALHDPPKVWGIEVGTDPTQVYMQQVFEQFALSNGARLIDANTGKVDLNTAAFIETLKFYKRLAGFTPPGDIYWRQTREDYHGGRAAMIIWSPFILDELAGLRDSAPVTATGLSKPLHEVTGIVTAFHGLSRERPVQWGQVSYFGITVGANSSTAKWAEFLLDDGYLDWLSMAPEGKFPLRPQFVDGWKNLEIGVDSRSKISDLYTGEIIDSIIAGVGDFDRWGFSAGKGACVGQIYGTKVMIRILRRYLDGEMTAEAAANEMTNAIRGLEGCS